MEAPTMRSGIECEPVDLEHIAEVTEIQFASSDLVSVAARCLADLSKESSVDESIDHSAGDTAAMQSASGRAEVEIQDVESGSAEQNRSEKAFVQSSTQHEEGESSGAVSGRNQNDDSQQKDISDSVPQHRNPLNNLRCHLIERLLPPNQHAQNDRNGSFFLKESAQDQHSSKNQHARS